MPKPRLPFAASLLLTLSTGPAAAVHLDVELKGDGDRLIVGYCLSTGVGCDLPGALGTLGLPAGQLPVDWETGDPLFAADFADPFKPYDTANPGFQAANGALQAGERIRYRALGNLLYWDPAQMRWMAAPAEVQIRLFGGLDARTVVVQDPSQCGGLLICIPGESQETVYEESSTVFSAFGISASPTLLISEAKAKGTLHSHLDWFLERSDGTKGGPTGAYLVRMQLESERRSRPSAAFGIVFNNGLTDVGLATAIAARMSAPASPPRPVETPTPTPTPAPTPIPTPTPSEQSDPGFQTFAYTENGEEKLKSCARVCRTAVTGSASAEASITFNDTFTAATLAKLAKIQLALGTRVYQGAFTASMRRTLMRSARGNLNVTVRDLANGGRAALRVSWDANGGIRLKLKTATPVFAEETLADALAVDANRLETVNARFFDVDGAVLGSFTGSLDLAATLNRKTLKKRSLSYRLGKLKLAGTVQAG